MRNIPSGLIAGIMSVVVFTVIHDLLISDIWFSIIPMVITGAVCGASLGWSYGLIDPVQSLRKWLLYNTVYLGMFLLLGAVSVIVFEPITTAAAVIAANKPPHELFGKAMPMTLTFLVGMVLLMGLLFGKNWRHYGAIFLTSLLLMAFLGLNVAIIGLVAVPVESLYLIAELFVLIFVLDIVFALVFWFLESVASSYGMD